MQVSFAHLLKHNGPKGLPPGHWTTPRIETFTGINPMNGLTKQHKERAHQQINVHRMVFAKHFGLDEEIQRFGPHIRTQRLKLPM